MIKRFEEYINEAMGANSMERDPLDLIQRPDTKRASAFMFFQGASSSIPNHWNNSPFLSGGRLTSAFGLNPRKKKKGVLNYYDVIEIASGNATIQFNTQSTGRRDWDNDLKRHRSDFTQFIVNMSPADFLERIQYHRFIIDKDKVYDYAEKLSKNAKNVPLPTMWFANEFQYRKGLAPSFHDGSHRVMALHELGVDKIPVKIIY